MVNNVLSPGSPQAGRLVNRGSGARLDPSGMRVRDQMERRLSLGVPVRLCARWQPSRGFREPEASLPAGIVSVETGNAATKPQATVDKPFCTRVRL